MQSRVSPPPLVPSCLTVVRQGMTARLFLGTVKPAWFSWDRQRFQNLECCPRRNQRSVGLRETPLTWNARQVVRPGEVRLPWPPGSPRWPVPVMEVDPFGFQPPVAGYSASNQRGHVSPWDQKSLKPGAGWPFCMP